MRDVIASRPGGKPKENTMTQAYYTYRLLLVYANLINETRLFHDRRGILQELNDNSHETRSADNVVVRFKQANCGAETGAIG